MNLDQLTERKIGGVPLIYIGAVVVGLLIFVAIKPVAPVEPLEESDIEGDGPGFEGDGTGRLEVSNPVFLTNPIAPVSTGLSAITEDSNDVWSRRAIEYLISQGSTVGTATVVITKYMDSETLSITEAALRDKAVKQLGLPPEGIVRTSTENAIIRPPASGGTPVYQGPATAQGTPPTKHKVTGRSDTTFKALARLYYGRENDNVIELLNAANTSAKEPLFVGAVITIPKRTRPEYYKATGATKTLPDIARKNNTTGPKVRELNPGVNFPVKVGTRVRVR